MMRRRYVVMQSLNNRDEQRILTRVLSRARLKAVLA